ncbi:hypothetical protein [Sorangium cellulosum]|uniref:hypothetical protein n=1 Tax=Sorangium cellulosum TaxID=56 RepID=UPI00041A0139|nr:hypothetical protein [Sorangium cellulosum]
MKRLVVVALTAAGATGCWLLLRTERPAERSSAELKEEARPERARPQRPRVARRDLPDPVEIEMTSAAALARGDERRVAGKRLPLQPAAEEPDGAEEPEGDGDPRSEAERLRRPIIQAIRGEHPSPVARREAMLKALEGSGEDRGRWTTAAPEIFAFWQRAMPDDAGAVLDPEASRCFRAGCEVDVRFADEAAYERAAAVLRHLKEDVPGHGGRVQTPPERLPSGEVQATWILLRPERTD